MDQGFQILERIIKTSVFRHKVLASNIANADTPGYKAKEVSFGQAMDSQSTGLTKTDPNHIRGTNKATEGGGMDTEEQASWEDGNNVVLDMELAKMTENTLLYQAGVQLLSRKLQMYKNAMK